MAMSLASQFAHWHHFFENTSVSSVDFYNSLEKALKDNQVPDTKSSRIEFLERGLLSSKRIYLEVRRDWLMYHICVAPFGTGFFVSSRLIFDRWGSRTTLALFGLLLYLFVLLIYTVMTVLLYDPRVVSFFTFLLGILVTLVFLLVLASWIYRCLYMTYYRLDTMLAFHEAVHRLVVANVNKVIEPSGKRPLTEEESKPVMHKLLGRR